jgi:hypothetical protein
MAVSSANVTNRHDDVSMHSRWWQAPRFVTTGRRRCQTETIEMYGSRPTLIFAVVFVCQERARALSGFVSPGGSCVRGCLKSPDSVIFHRLCFPIRARLMDFNHWILCRSCWACHVKGTKATFRLGSRFYRKSARAENKNGNFLRIHGTSSGLTSE